MKVIKKNLGAKKIWALKKKEGDKKKKKKSLGAKNKAGDKKKKSVR